MDFSKVLGNVGVLGADAGIQRRVASVLPQRTQFVD